MERRLGGGGGGWRARLLSREGRLVLLKAVLSAIPTYFMSLFRVPVGVCKRMEAIMRNFFWHGVEIDGTQGRALVKWSAVCQPTAYGGLGVRNLRHTNTALLMKWVHDEALYVVVKTHKRRSNKIHNSKLTMTKI